MAIGGNSICKRCECFFKQNGRDFCDRCHSLMTDEGKYIRMYLEQNLGASLMDMSVDLNISMKNINLFLNNQGSFLAMAGDENEKAKDMEFSEKSLESCKSGKMHITRRRRR